MNWPAVIVIGIFVLVIAAITIEIKLKGVRSKPLSQMRPKAIDVSTTLHSKTFGRIDVIGNKALLENTRRRNLEEKEKHDRSHKRAYVKRLKLEKLKRIRPWDDTEEMTKTNQDPEK